MSIKITIQEINAIDHVALGIHYTDYVDGVLLSKKDCDDLEFLAGRLLVTPQLNDAVDPLLDLIHRDFE